jgi:AraC-like DNA-binding protein
MQLPVRDQGQQGPDAAEAADGWMRATFVSLEEHRAVVRRARPNMGWTSSQLTAAAIRGSITGCREAGWAVTTTAISGHFEFHGPLSESGFALSLALDYPTAGYQWMHPVRTGMIGLYRPGSDTGSVIRGEARFAVIDIPEAVLAAEISQHGYRIEPSRLFRQGIVPGRVPPERLSPIARLVALKHRGVPVPLPPGIRLNHLLLAAVVDQVARAGGVADAEPFSSHHRIVARARAYIDAHLGQPIAIDDLAAASFASRRTLHRAFIDILGETPLTYVLKLRLNRIRRDLATPSEQLRTVTTVSHRWGIGELGRLAGRYRAQFGELPSETLARRQAANAA